MSSEIEIQITTISNRGRFHGSNKYLKSIKAQLSMYRNIKQRKVLFTLFLVFNSNTTMAKTEIAV